VFSFEVWQLKFHWSLDVGVWSFCSISQKPLAEFRAPTETRVAMDTTPRLPNRARAFVATSLLAGFFWTLALGVSPLLHARVHRDAAQPEHSCAVTMIAAGSYTHSTHVPLVSAPLPTPQFAKIAALTPQWVEPLFLGAAVFEHAPPARA
jgi:hypothetical protein